MTSAAHVVCSDLDTAVVLRPAGEFDLASVDLLHGSFVDALSETSRIVVDLSGTSFLDCTALGAIVAASRRAREAGGWLRLVAPQPNVRKILAITAIGNVLGLYDTVDQALTHTTDTGRASRGQPEAV